MKHKILVVSSLLALTGLLGFLAFGSGPTVKLKVSADAPLNAYAPTQPIPYSHKLHAGDLQMDCNYCHTYARRSRAAGIPAQEQCMACHTLIATDKDPIKQMAKAFEKKEPIEWVKVHDLPDFVFFSHKRHVANFECQECHGAVEEMEVVYRQAPLTMGWCVNCHKDNRDKGASLDCLTCHK
jgi:hypothetical protein